MRLCVFEDSGVVNLEPLTLTRPGTYTLLMEGRYFETTPSTYSVVLTPQGTGSVPAFPTGTPLTLNGIVNNSIGAAGEQDVYTFTLSGAASLYFDVLGPNNGTAKLQVTVVGFADEIAAAASLIMGQAAEKLPVVLVRGLAWTEAPTPAQSLVRPAAEDLFR